jgi:hypothetical protein
MATNELAVEVEVKSTAAPPLSACATWSLTTQMRSGLAYVVPAACASRIATAATNATTSQGRYFLSMLPLTSAQSIGGDAPDPNIMRVRIRGS